MTAAPMPASHAFTHRQLFAVALASVVVLLAACGDRSKDKQASQTAAKVNKEEITVHQISFVLQQRGAPNAPTSKQVLERLIDQELAVQQAQELKLDRDPQVIQQIEASRREIISRAYLERIGTSVPKPSADEIKAYYDAKPVLFKERRIYSLQELLIQATPAQVEELRAKVLAAQDANEFVNYLKANNFKFAGNQDMKAAEQLPLATLDSLAQMKDGQAQFNVTPTGAHVVFLAGSRSQPVDMERASPVIELFLTNERKRKLIDEDLKSLRSSAKIEYVGEFSKPDAASAVLSKDGAAATATMVAASGPNAANLESGIKGLK